jgi:hypothetical protein
MLAVWHSKLAGGECLETREGYTTGGFGRGSFTNFHPASLVSAWALIGTQQ